jgi:NitT/TauT family transport system substrate-binding protein
MDNAPFTDESASEGVFMRYVSGLILFSVILAVNPCAPSVAHGQDKVRIGVPLFPTVSYPVFIAQERGFFERNGLKAEIIRINSEPTTYQALISGDIDATSGAPTGLVQSNIQGVPVVSLGSWDNLVSYTMVTREKIDDLAQLRGKKVGINRLGGKSSLILRVMLEDAGLNTSKDVTLLQLGGSQERLAALIRGGIDAAPVDFVFEPKMKQMGFHLVTGKKTPFMNGPITVTVASLKANRGKWVRFVKAYLDATQYMMTNREGSIEVLKKIVPDEKETLAYGYEQMRQRATVDLLPPDAAVENLIKMLAYVDKRAVTVDRSKLADYSILKELLQGRAGTKK